MSLTPNYNPNGLSPKILINDFSGTLQYTYESDRIAASPTKDFRLTSGAFHIGVNDDFGYFTFVIDDTNNVLTDGTAQANPLIKNQWEVELHLGKDSSSLNRWFYGKVIDVTVTRPVTNIKQLTVTVAGWGIKTKYRYTSIKRFQAKESDGVSLDDTDTTVKISELVKDIFQDTDHYITHGLTNESEITVTGVEDIDIKLPDFQQTSQTWASAISTLAAWGNAYWGIDANRDVFFRQVGQTDSGILITNDLDGLDAQGWDEDKLGYLQESIFEWSNSSDQSAFSVLHALGGNSIQIDINTEPTPNSIFTVETDWLAWKIEPTRDNIEKISLSLNRTGTPAAGNAEFIIVGDDGSGGPNIEDVRGIGVIGEEKLQALPTTGTNWVEISFNIKGGISISPREELFIVMKAYGDGSNNYGIENDTTTNTNYWTSTNPQSVGWTLVSGASGVTFLHRVYSNRSIIVTLEDLTAKIDFGIREVSFPMRQDVQVETIEAALVQAAKTLSKPKRFYRDVVTSAITDVVPVGKYCRIQDEMSGLDILADIVAVNGQFSADDDTNVGIHELTLTLQKF